MDLILLDSEEHIFISYQWDYQKTLLLVKTELESKGFQVWMDVNEVTGNIPQTTARAMEKSSVVLIAMSRKYQSSEICSSGSYIDFTELKQRRRRRHSTNDLITTRFSRDVTAAMLVYRTMAKKVSLGIWLCYHAKLERHFAIVLYINIVVSSRNWKPRISFSTQALICTFKKQLGYFARSYWSISWIIFYARIHTNEGDFCLIGLCNLQLKSKRGKATARFVTHRWWFFLFELLVDCSTQVVFAYLGT